MPWGLKRYQQARQLHYVTFTCYHRAGFLTTPRARDILVHNLERARRWYGFYIVGYVVMPEHVHLLVSEPQRAGFSRRSAAARARHAHHPARRSAFSLFVCRTPLAAAIHAGFAHTASLPTA